VVDFLKTPSKFARLGAQIPKGILLVGRRAPERPAGAGGRGRSRRSLLLDQRLRLRRDVRGVGAARVRDLFEQAKQKAPCIVFVDELDALGKVRGVGPITHEEREQTLNQLLVELDGFDTRVGVILMAATNRPRSSIRPCCAPGASTARCWSTARQDRTAGNSQSARRKVTLDPAADLNVVAAMTAGFAGADLRTS